MKVRESILKTETKSPKLLISPHLPARRSVLLLSAISQLLLLFPSLTSACLGPLNLIVLFFKSNKEAQ